MEVVEVLLLGAVAALWPVLLVVVAVALRTPHPLRVLAGFLAGGLLTCVVVGATIVHLLRGSSVVMESQHSVDPLVNLVCGGLALLAAFALNRYLASRRANPPPPKEKTGPSWTERIVGRGAVLAFAAGIVLDLVPGFVPVVALKDIAQIDGTAAETLALIVGFYVVMFALVEIPLAGYAFAPQRTAAFTKQFNDWLTANIGRVATGLLVVIGLVLVLRGVAAAVFG
jgi:Sap, sulfolipid-1-addressing protein